MPTLDRVVIRFGDQSVYGHVEHLDQGTIEDVLGGALPGPDQIIRVRLLDSGAVQEIPIADAKAIFFVHTFEGDPVRHAINFHSRAPVTTGIWMRLQFYDGEIIEGIVHNSVRYLLDAGFFIIPTDPGSNNKLVYVIKKAIVDHQVLGLRKL